MAGRFRVDAVFRAVDQVTGPVRAMQSSLGRMLRTTERRFRRLNRSLDGFVAGIGRAAKAVIGLAATGVGVLATSVGLLVREFSKVENAEAAFTPLLGGAERAKEAVQALNDTAASTPFQFETLAKSAGHLLPVMDGDIENTIKTLRMLGDTAGGNAQKLDSITRGFTKAMLKGKVDLESLNMIAEAGVPIFGDLADVMGTEVNAAFFKMISAGEITTDHLTAAFEKMTSEGGKFFKGMEISSKTTTGLFSTLKDNISLTAAELGSVLAPTVKDLIRGATQMAKGVREWVKNNRELISDQFIKFVETAKKAISGVIDSLQALNSEKPVLERLGEIVTAASDAFRFLAKHGKTILKLTAAIVGLSLALKVFMVVLGVINAVILYPIVLGIAAIVAVIAALIFWFDELKEAFFSSGKAVDFIVAGIALLFGPVGWMIGAAALIIKHWEPIKEFFKQLWDGVVGIFDAAVSKIIGVVDSVRDAVGFVVDTISKVSGDVSGAFGFGDDEDDDEGSQSTRRTRGGGRRGRGRAATQVSSPNAEVMKSINEMTTTSKSEVTIMDETGRAVVTGGGFGSGLTMQQTGDF